MKPFFAYYGGKQRMAHNIIPLIPKHIVYCEPFAGGASILFLKSHPPTNNYIEVINDTNNLVYNFYKQLRDNPEELQRLINGTAYCEQTYKDTIDVCKRKKQATNAIRAWAFFVNINMSFSNQLNTGWRRGIFSGNLSYYWYSRIKNLNFGNHLAEVYHEHFPFFFHRPFFRVWRPITWLDECRLARDFCH